MFCIRYFQFYRKICFVSASERDGLKGSLAKFGFGVGLCVLPMCMALGLAFSLYFQLIVLTLPYSVILSDIYLQIFVDCLLVK